MNRREKRQEEVDWQTETLLTMITAFLDPHDMAHWFTSCWSSMWVIRNTPVVWVCRLQSAFSYFSVTRQIADVWKAYYNFRLELVPFLKFVAYKMQRIMYVATYVVDPLHRSLVVASLLNLPWVLASQDMTDEEIADDFGSRPVPYSLDQPNRGDNYLVTRQRRFQNEAVFGDWYYSINPDSWHFDQRGDEPAYDLAPHALLVYVYQDEDNDREVRVKYEHEGLEPEGGVLTVNEEGRVKVIGGSHLSTKEQDDNSVPPVLALTTNQVIQRLSSLALRTITLWGIDRLVCGPSEEERARN